MFDIRILLSFPEIIKQFFADFLQTQFVKSAISLDAELKTDGLNDAKYGEIDCLNIK